MQQWLNCSFLCVRSFRMEKIKDAVCLIECMDQEKKVKFTGTGFHYGSGWVMTAAHNFQDDENDDKSSHSYLSEGKFRVLIHVKGKEYEFPQRKRMAFVHHLNPGEATDFENKDIGMVKLGIQYEYGRNQDDYSDWEKEEKKMLDEMLPSNFGLAQVAAAEPKVEDSVYVVYYGDDNENKLVKEVKITDIAEGKQAKTTTFKRSKPGDKRTFLLMNYLALLKILPENGL